MMFGLIPLDATDWITRDIIWKKFAEVNTDYKINLKTPEAFNNSNVVVQLNFEYTERVFE